MGRRTWLVLSTSRRFGLFISFQGSHLNARLAQLGTSPSHAAGKPSCARSHAAYYRFSRPCLSPSSPRLPSWAISRFDRAVSVVVLVVDVIPDRIVLPRCVIIRGMELETHRL
ncbi:hypothetical protein MTO96_034606 [Rhipicephalus appendiculatus]